MRRHHRPRLDPQWRKKHHHRESPIALSFGADFFHDRHDLIWVFQNSTAIVILEYFSQFTVVIRGSSMIIAAKISGDNFYGLIEAIERRATPTKRIVFGKHKFAAG